MPRGREMIKLKATGKQKNFNQPLNFFKPLKYVTSFKQYIKHETSCQDKVMQKMFKVNTNSQLAFLRKMKAKMLISKLKPNFTLIRKKIFAIEDNSFDKNLKEKVFLQIKNQFKKKSSRLFISNKIIPFSHPIRRRIFNKNKSSFDITLKPVGYKKKRSSNLHEDELIKILGYKNEKH